METIITRAHGRARRWPLLFCPGLEQRVFFSGVVAGDVRRFVNRWRFRWGTVMEAFNDANLAKRQDWMVGQSGYIRQADSQPDVSSWLERRPRVAGRQGMGRR
ncbi:MAG: hypothetical protein FWF31_00905 [Desulfobulbus sp.]|nr:hypothetical protein [Desulfobulbus sp.]